MFVTEKNLLLFHIRNKVPHKKPINNPNNHDHAGRNRGEKYNKIQYPDAWKKLRATGVSGQLPQWPDHAGNCKFAGYS